MLSVLDVLPVGFCSSDVQGSFKRQNKSKSQISLKMNVPLLCNLMFVCRHNALLMLCLGLGTKSLC